MRALRAPIEPVEATKFGHSSRVEKNRGGRVFPFAYVHPVRNNDAAGCPGSKSSDGSTLATSRAR